MPLFKRRQELAEISRQEADGQSFWSPVFRQETRNRFWVRTQRALRTQDVIEQVLGVAYPLLLDDLGLLRLNRADSPAAQMFEFSRVCDDEEFVSFLEAVLHAVVEVGAGHDPQAVFTAVPRDYDRRASDFMRGLSSLLREDRVSYELTWDRKPFPELLPLSSKAMHVGVLDPAVTLLANEPGWEAVEQAFRKALDELSRNDFGDAITDAGTALQEALVLMGCDGNALGPLIADATKKGLLAPSDARLQKVVTDLGHWVSANRSERGDSHKVTAATEADAWLMVHVVGALILWLSAQQ